MYNYLTRANDMAKAISTIRTELLDMVNRAIDSGATWRDIVHIDWCRTTIVDLCMKTEKVSRKKAMEMVSNARNALIQ